MEPALPQNPHKQVGKDLMLANPREVLRGMKDHTANENFIKPAAVSPLEASSAGLSLAGT